MSGFASVFVMAVLLGAASFGTGMLPLSVAFSSEHILRHICVLVAELPIVQRPHYPPSPLSGPDCCLGQLWVWSFLSMSCLEHIGRLCV